MHELTLLSIIILGLTACAPGTNLPLAAPPTPATYVVTEAEAPIHSIAGGKATAQLYLHAQNGSNLGALTILILQPGAAVPEHRHQASAEILYMLEGTMEMVIDGLAVSASSGSAIHIPLGAPHSAKVSSTTPVKAVQFYVAPGPEQRFRQGPQLPNSTKPPK